MAMATVPVDIMNLTSTTRSSPLTSRDRMKGTRNNVVGSNNYLKALKECWQKIQSGTANVKANTTATNDTKDEGQPFVTREDLERVILPAMREQQDAESIYWILQCLANFASSASPSSTSSSSSMKEDNKSMFVTCGALEYVIEILQLEGEVTCVNQEHLFSAALEVLAHISHNASDALKNDFLLPALPVIHQVMTNHALNEPVQGFGCSLLRNMSNPLLQEMVAAGSLGVLIQAMQHHPSSARVQEEGNISLYNLLPLCPASVVAAHPDDAILQEYRKRATQTTFEMNKSMTEISVEEFSLSPPSSPKKGQDEDHPQTVAAAEADKPKFLPEIVLNGMKASPSYIPVQQYGVLVLHRLCRKDSGQYELVVSYGGLTIVVSHLLHDLALKDECLAQVTCLLLRDWSRQSTLDILRAMAAKGGIDAILAILEHYSQDLNIQDPAMAFLRNLCIHPDNRQEIIQQHFPPLTPPFPSLDYDNGVTTTTSTTQPSTTKAITRNCLGIVTRSMDRNHADPVIQAYSCDILGRLSLENDKVAAIIASNETIRIALIAMKLHREHGGVQDRVVFLLLALCESYPPALETLKWEFSSLPKDLNRSNFDKTKIWAATRPEPPPPPAVSAASPSSRELVSYLKATDLPTHGEQRLKKLIQIVVGRATSLQDIMKSIPGFEGQVLPTTTIQVQRQKQQQQQQQSSSMLQSPPLQPKQRRSVLEKFTSSWRKHGPMALFVVGENNDENGNQSSILRRSSF